MVILSVVFLLIGVSLFFVRRQQQHKMLSIQLARRSTAADLLETAGAVADEIGGGSWRDYVKIWGETTAESPLQSEHKHIPCVHYVSEVIREYEVTETKEDTRGNRKTETRRQSETITRHCQSMPFFLRDQTGTVTVNPEGASIETVSVLDEFRSKPSGNTLGYRYREAVLPIGRQILVIGAVSDITGEVTLGKPVKGSHKYVISLQDEAALASATTQAVRNTLYGMVGCLSIGVVLLIVSLVR